MHLHPLTLCCPRAAEAQLPFAVEQRSQASWTSEGVGSGADKRLERVESEPPLPVSRQVLLTQQPAGQQPLFSSLRKHSKAGREAVARLPLTQSLEEDDDYVIIERTHSSSGSRFATAGSARLPNDGVFFVFFPGWGVFSYGWR
jgi:hypothetical protein